MDSVPPGWYPDPQYEGLPRYWNGTVWIDDHVPASTADKAEHSPRDLAQRTKIPFFGTRERLVITDNEPVELPVRTGQDTAADLIPRSVKISAELDRACKKRAGSLGLSQSAYIRRLIEQDIAASGTDEQRPAWVLELLAVIAHHENDEYPKTS